jgi:hypothetical protein
MEKWNIINLLHPFDFDYSQIAFPFYQKKIVNDMKSYQPEVVLILIQAVQYIMLSLNMFISCAFSFLPRISEEVLATIIGD